MSQLSAIKPLFKKGIEKIETTPLTLGTWVVTFFSIVLIRYAIEKLLVNFEGLSFVNALFTLSHYFLEFLFVALLFFFIFRFAGNGSFLEVANLTLFGFLLIWTPPIVDYFILHNPGVFSLYEFGTLKELGHSFFTFFDESPEIGITYGIRFEIFVAIIVVALYSYLKLGRLFRAIASGFFTYLMLFVTSTFPSWLAILILGPTQGFFAVGEPESVKLFLSPTPVFGQVTSLLNAAHFKMSLVYAGLLPFLIGLVLYTFFRPTFVTLFKNARFPQVLYHGGLFLLGALFAFVYGQPVLMLDFFHFLALFVMLEAVICAWLASVVVNDFMDLSIDRCTNPTRPLLHETPSRAFYRSYGALLFTASFFLALLISPAAALLLVGYQALAWVYSAWPFRLKRFPLIATIIASASSLLIFFAGYIVFAGDKTTTDLPWHIPVFLFVAYTFALPLKDFKDIPGDQADGVITLPVLLGETRAKRFIGTAIFTLFVASVFLLHAKHLLLLALFFGSFAYWMLQLSNLKHRYLSYRALPAWMITLVTAYGVLLYLSLS